jgi:hypothetical protein
MRYNDAVDMLGYSAKDKVTKQCGVISSVCFDLYGCIQVLLTPLKVKNNIDIRPQGWFDINRIIITNKKRIMTHPSFENKYNNVNDTGGPSEKPTTFSNNK